MNPTIDKKAARLLSLYIDNELSPEERRNVEEELGRNSLWQDELLRLRRLQGIVAAKKPLPQSPYFMTKLSERLKNLDGQESLFPFGRRWLPVALGGALAATVIIVAALFMQKDSVVRFVDERSSQVRDWYEQKILNGGVGTLFATLTNDDVLNFALTGMLPVDKSNGRVLQFGDESVQGHFVQAENGIQQTRGGLTSAGLVSQLHLDVSQSIALDSLLRQYRTRIENSMLVSQQPDSQFMAINADVWAMNKVLMVNIARTLKPNQRVRFAGMLASAHSPVHLNIEALDLPMTDTIVINFQKYHPSNKFVILTPETLFVKEMSKAFSDRFAARYEQINPSLADQMDRMAETSREHAVEIIENLKRHQAFNDLAYQKKIDESLRRYDSEKQSLESALKRSAAARELAAQALRRAERMLVSLPDSMTLRIEFHKQLVTFPPRFSEEMNRIVMPNPAVRPHGVPTAVAAPRQSPEPGEVWRVQMPDSIRMVIEPRHPGVVLAGDDILRQDTFSQRTLQNVGGVDTPRGSRQLELRLRQLEKELQQMRKRLEKLEEP